jgi:hypothetical protein
MKNTTSIQVPSGLESLILSVDNIRLQKREIVVIEEDKVVRDNICDCLDWIPDIIVSPFSDGEEARKYLLEYFSNFHTGKDWPKYIIPLIIADVNLGEGIKGTEIVSECKKEDHNIKSIIITDDNNRITDLIKEDVHFDMFLRRPDAKRYGSSSIILNQLNKEFYEKLAQYSISMMNKYQISANKSIETFIHFSRQAFAVKNTNESLYKMYTRNALREERCLHPSNIQLLRTEIHSNQQFFYGYNYIKLNLPVSPTVIIRSKDERTAELAYKISSIIRDNNEHKDKHVPILDFNFYFNRYMFLDLTDVINYKDLFSVMVNYPKCDQVSSRLKAEIVKEIINDTFNLQSIKIPEPDAVESYSQKTIDDLSALAARYNIKPLNEEEIAQIKSRMSSLESRAACGFYDRSPENTGLDVFRLLIAAAYDKINIPDMSKSDLTRYLCLFKSKQVLPKRIIHEIIPNLHKFDDKEMTDFVDLSVKNRLNFDWDKVLTTKVSMMHDYVQIIENPVFGFDADKQTELFESVLVKLAKSGTITSANKQDLLKELYETSIYWNHRRAYYEKGSEHLYLHNVLCTLKDIMKNLKYEPIEGDTNIREPHPENRSIEEILYQIYEKSIEAVYAEIKEKSKPYWNIRMSDVHLEEVLKISEKLRLLPDYKRKIKREVYMPALIMHDNGWSAVPVENIQKEFDGRLSQAEKDNNRNEHQKAGVDYGRKILDEVSYFPEYRQEILHIIETHDTKSKPKTLNEQHVRECDRLWRVSKTGFAIDLQRMNKTPSELYFSLKGKIDSLMYSSSGKTLFESELNERKKEYNINE